jgi:hypothetical protein
MRALRGRSGDGQGKDMAAMQVGVGMARWRITGGPGCIKVRGMKPETQETRRLVVFADYCQYFLQDLDAHGIWMRSHGADPALAPAGWTEEAVYGHRIGVEPYSLAIGTARRDVVEVSLRIHRSAPAADLEGAEHVVEADLGLPGGDLAICEVAGDPGEERHVRVAAGSYRVRVSYLPSGPPLEGSNQSEPGDHFLYQIDLWPTARAAALAVLKQGPRLWAG